jgi:hypothetical protein
MESITFNDGVARRRCTLNMAAWTRHTDLKGLICHTNAGLQYTAVSHTDRIDVLGRLGIDRHRRRQFR